MPESSGTERAEEDRQLFEMDKHRSQTRQQLLQCRGQLAMKAKARRRAELCLAEVRPLPAETTAFKAVGRMFLQTPLPAICADLLTLIARSEDDVVKLQAQEKHLSADLDTTERAIDEIVGKEHKQQ